MRYGSSIVPLPPANSKGDTTNSAGAPLNVSSNLIFFKQDLGIYSQLKDELKTELDKHIKALSKESIEEIYYENEYGLTYLNEYNDNLFIHTRIDSYNDRLGIILDYYKENVNNRIDSLKKEADNNKNEAKYVFGIGEATVCNSEWFIATKYTNLSYLYYKEYEYTMDKDGCYKPAGMNLHVYREYCAWWDNVLKKTDKFGIKDTDILALEYYPYHTRRSNDSKHWVWDTFATKSLIKNKELLLKHIANGVPVFGYYYGFWLNDKDVGKQLSGLNKKQFCKSRNGLGQSLKLKDLENWLQTILV